LRSDSIQNNLYNKKYLKRFWFRKKTDKNIEQNKNRTEKIDETDKSENLENKK